MLSQARQELSLRLKDFDEIIKGRDAICPPNPGEPAQRQGSAIVRAAVVMLAAAFEGDVEDVFDAAVDLIHAGELEADRKTFKKDTSGSMNTANTFKVNRLFFNLGIPWIMKHNSVRWQKFTNQSVRDTLDKIVSARNSIAHGGKKSVRKSTATKWKGCIEKLSDRIDSIVADRIESETENRPW